MECVMYIKNYMVNQMVNQNQNMIVIIVMIQDRDDQLNQYGHSGKDIYYKNKMKRERSTKIDYYVN